MAVGDVYRVSNEFLYQGNPNSYGWLLQVEEEASAATLINGLLSFGSSRQAALLPLHNELVLFECVTARQVYPNFSLPKSLATGVEGTRPCTPTLAVLPGQCSCIVTLYGNKLNPTRSNRGRDFLTGACCDDQANGSWNTGSGSYLQAVCDMYQEMTSTYTSLTGNVFRIGVWSEKINQFFPLEYVRAHAFVRTQRRRQPTGRCEETCEANIAVTAPT